MPCTCRSSSSADSAAWESFRWPDFVREFRSLAKTIPSPPGAPGSTERTVELLSKTRDLLAAIASPRETRNKPLVAKFFADRSRLPKCHPNLLDAERPLQKGFNATWPKYRALFFEWAGTVEDGSDLDPHVAAINEKKWPQAALVVAQLAYPFSALSEALAEMCADHAFLDALCIATAKGHRVIAKERYLEDQKCSDSDLDRAGYDLINCLCLLSGLTAAPEAADWIATATARASPEAAASPCQLALVGARKFERALRKIGYTRNADSARGYIEAIGEKVFGKEFALDPGRFLPGAHAPLRAAPRMIEGVVPAPVPAAATRAKVCCACGNAASADSPLRVCSACKNAWYCNAACQASDWGRHKAGCQGAKRPSE